MIRELPEVHREVGKRIALIRLRSDKTQEKLAGDVGMSASYLSQLEAGKRNPTVKKLVRISAALKVDIGEFFKI